MDRPERLHCLGGEGHFKLQDIRTVTYADDNCVAFRELACCCENAKSVANPVVILESSSGRLTGFQTVEEYRKAEAERSREAIDSSHRHYQETTKKILESYSIHIDSAIEACAVDSIYNRVLSLASGSLIDDRLLEDIRKYISLINYKCELVPLKRAEVLSSKIATMASIFEESRQDDERVRLTMVAASTMVLASSSRNQKKVHDREFVLNCLAIVASLKFEDVTDKEHGMFT